MTREEIEAEVARLMAANGITLKACPGECGKQIGAHEHECWECQGARRSRTGGSMGRSGNLQAIRVNAAVRRWR